MSERLSLLAGARRSVAMLVVMALLLGFMASSATATAGASVSGRVVDKDGNALPGVEVGLFYAEQFSGWPSRTVNTAPDGTYTFTSVDPRAYKLRYAKSGYATRWWDGQFQFEKADGFIVGPGEPLTSYDATLSRAGAIVGTMTVPPSIDATTVGWVHLCTADGKYTWGQRYGPDDPMAGRFAFTLEPGTYFIRWEPDDPRLVREWYDGKAARDAATPVVVSAEATSEVTLAMREGATITGRVTDETTGLAGIGIAVSDADGNLAGATTSTDETGFYKVEGLPPGRYQLRAVPDEGGPYVSEYYNDKLSAWQADVVTLGIAEKRADVDFQLAKGATIEGKVTGAGKGLPLVDVWLLGQTPDGEQVNAETRTAGDGSYSISGLPAGTYGLCFDPYQLNESNIASLAAPTGFATEYFEDKSSIFVADPIVVSAKDVRRIDATLTAGAAIRGKVWNLGRTAGLGGMRVTAFTRMFGQWYDVEDTYSGPDGSYEIRGLAPGTYVVAFGDGWGVWGDNARYYQDASTPDEATKLTLTEGQVLGGVDGVSLQTVGRIQGRVLGSDGRPAARVKVVFAREKNGVYGEVPGDFTYTDPDGLFHGMGVGNVKLRFTDPERRYADAVRQQAVVLEAGRSVTIEQTLPYLGVDSAEGADRFATCVEISRRAFPDGADGIVIATGRNWPDALGGAGLTGVLNGPVLLVEKDGIPPVVLAEIARLANNAYARRLILADKLPDFLLSRIQRVYILGGPDAVSSKVEEQLRGMFDRKDDKPTVVRIAGGDRYETADKVAGEVVTQAEEMWDGTALVSTGLDCPDALAASPLAAASAWPLFLVRPTGVTTATMQSMAAKGVKKVLLLGGPGALPKATVEDPLKARFGAANVVRLGGSTRYNTALEIAKYAVSLPPRWGRTFGMTWNGLGITTGRNFPDALSGGVLLGKNGSVMLLTPPGALDPAVEAQIRAKKSEIGLVRFFGGPLAVSQKVRDQVAAARR